VPVWEAIPVLEAFVRRPDKAEFRNDSEAAFCHFARMPKLTSMQIKAALTDVPEWKRRAATISRTYQVKDFVAALKFVNRIGKLAEKAWHHPDIDIRWNKVTLTLTTHDQGGLTEKDFKLAKEFDKAA